MMDRRTGLVRFARCHYALMLIAIVTPLGLYVGKFSSLVSTFIIQLIHCATNYRYWPTVVPLTDWRPILFVRDVSERCRQFLIFSRSYYRSRSCYSVVSVCLSVIC